jgi:hypothetical protein
LPSFSEGLPMSVLEAWSYGLPVVMTPECNLPEGFACGAALEIRNASAFQPATSHSLLATPTNLDSDWDGLRSILEMTDAQRGETGMRGEAACGRKIHLAKGGSAPQRILRESAVRSTSNSSPE